MAPPATTSAIECMPFITQLKPIAAAQNQPTREPMAEAASIAQIT